MNSIIVRTLMSEMCKLTALVLIVRISINTLEDKHTINIYVLLNIICIQFDLYREREIFILKRICIVDLIIGLLSNLVSEATSNDE